MLQFTLTGRLAADPQIGTLGPTARQVAQLRVASNNPGRSDTDVHDIALFGDPVDRLRHARKGDNIKLRGVAHRHTWTAADGTRNHRIDLIAQSVEHIGRPADTTARQLDANRHTDPAATHR